MPAGDRTGPMGAGPMTGRAAGYCAGYPVPGYANPGPVGGGGRGFGGGGGRGFGGGRRGWRHRYWATAVPDQAWAWPIPQTAPVAGQAADPQTEATMLRQQIAQVEQTLKAMSERLGQLEGQATDGS